MSIRVSTTPRRASKPKLDAAVLDVFRDWGRQGGKKGGASRMAQLTADERRALAKKAAAARWGKTKKKPKK